ncbi:hypothetical protein VNO78_21770 [Psophocarpus tetragonolobus]|uniref:Uncharacterized protein n=1 Tax=Psophocarpus tetragonolobus TaxID=3891 RepID=A0AAN9SCR3_PSOTE
MKVDEGWQLVGKSRRLKGRGWKGGSRFQGKASSKEKPFFSKVVRGASGHQKSYATAEQGGLNSYADAVKANKGNGGAPAETQSSVQLSSQFLIYNTMAEDVDLLSKADMNPLCPPSLSCASSFVDELPFVLHVTEEWPLESNVEPKDFESSSGSSCNFSNNEAELEAADRRWEAMDLGLGLEDIRVALDQSAKVKCCSSGAELSSVAGLAGIPNWKHLNRKERKQVNITSKSIQGHVKGDEAFTFSHACEDGKHVSIASSSGHGKDGRKHLAVWKEVRRHSVDDSVTGLLGSIDIIFKSSSPHMPYPTQKVLVSQTAGPEDCVSEGHEVKKVASAGMRKALQISGWWEHRLMSGMRRKLAEWKGEIKQTRKADMGAFWTCLNEDFLQ